MFSNTITCIDEGAPGYTTGSLGRGGREGEGGGGRGKEGEGGRGGEGSREGWRKEGETNDQRGGQTMYTFHT